MEHLMGLQCGIFHIGGTIPHYKIFHIIPCNSPIYYRKMPSRNVKEHIWEEENMRNAVDAVRNKRMGYLAASKKCPALPYSDIVKKTRKLGVSKRKP